MGADRISTIWRCRHHSACNRVHLPDAPTPMRRSGSKIDGAPFSILARDRHRDNGEVRRLGFAPIPGRRFNFDPGAFRGERNGEKNDAILAPDRPASSLRRRDLAHPRFEPGGGNPLADEPSRNDEARLPMFLGGAARLNRSAFRFPLRRGGRAAWEADTHDICSSVPPIVDRRRHKGRINGDAGLAPGRARNSFSRRSIIMPAVGHSGIGDSAKNIGGVK